MTAAYVLLFVLFIAKIIASYFEVKTYRQKMFDEVVERNR